MKGYITFLLVFAGIAVILATISIMTQNRINHARAIELEKMYYLELDVKNTLLDLAKQGANEAIRKYIAEETAKALILKKPLYLDKEEMVRRAQAGAHDEMKKIREFDFGPEYGVIAWCGSTTDEELGRLASRIYASKRAHACAECTGIEDEGCKDYIQVHLDDEGSSAQVQFLKSGPVPGIIGVSVYSTAELASASYIPPGVIR